jgi:hypothetical protein
MHLDQRTLGFHRVHDNAVVDGSSSKAEDCILKLLEHLTKIRAEISSYTFFSKRTYLSIRVESQVDLEMKPH